MASQSSGQTASRLRRLVVTSVVLGLLAILLGAIPASATHGHGKWAPAVRIFAWTNDDGRPGHLDPGDVGGISPAYDRWGHRSSDDPTAPGMDPGRIDSDVARCKAIRIDQRTVRIRVQNAYPGYVCTFTAVSINKAGVKLVLDEITINVGDGLTLTELDALQVGDTVKQRRRLYGTYAVTVLQEAPEGETLEFDIEMSFTKRDRHPPPKCCNRCWR